MGLLWEISSLPLLRSRAMQSDRQAVLKVPAGSPSRGGDVAVYVFDINQPSLPTPFFLLFFKILFFYFSLYGLFNCISFHKFSRQLSTFSLCSSGSYFCLIGPFNYLFANERLLQP